MTWSRDLDPVLLARYLSGEASPAEVALVRAWLVADARHRVQLDEMRRAWSSTFPLERPVDVDAAWRNVAATMHADAGGLSAPERFHAPLRLEGAHQTPARGVLVPPRHTPVIHVERRGSRTRAGIAAAAAVLIAAAGTVMHEGWPDRHAPVAVARTTRDFVAAKGQRALIDLADGTHIVLAPATHLHVSLPTHGAGVRDVTLEGEAMFTVTHDAARPFVVHSRYGTTVDVGTSFAVRAFPGEAYRVVVREGRVALGGRRAPVLVAGDVATREDDGALHITHGQDAAAILDWTNGRLTFEHTRFADLVPELERWYGIDIRITAPALRDRPVTGQLDTESRSEAMDALGRTLGAQHTTDGSHVTFSLRGETR